MSTKKKKDTKWIWITGAVAVLCVLLVAVLVVSGGNSGRRLQEQLRLGEKYLTELDYEQAIAAYRAAIEIDPKCEEAYLGLADVYVAKGEPEQAAVVLQTGYEETGSRTLQNKLEEVNVLVQQAQGDSGAADADGTAGQPGADGEVPGEGGNLPEGGGSQDGEGDIPEGGNPGDGVSPEGENGGQSGDNPSSNQSAEFTQWVDSLYERLMNDLYDDIWNEIAADPDGFLEKCRPYEDVDWKIWDYEAGYRLYTSDGKMLGVVAYDDEAIDTREAFRHIHLFYCPHDGEEDEYWHEGGFEAVGYGDREVTYSTREDIIPSGWSDGTTVHYYTDELEDYVLDGEGDLFEVWHT